MSDSNFITMSISLQDQVTNLMQKVQELTIQLNKSQSQSHETKIEEYRNVQANINQSKDVSLHIFKSLPERIQFANQYNYKEQKKEEEATTNPHFMNSEQQFEQREMYQEINNIEDECNYQRTIVDDKDLGNISTDDDESSSIFLGD